ncbi:hypothetical protein HK104_006097, partial [Borealophlyctis nickersoniae]
MSQPLKTHLSLILGEPILEQSDTALPEAEKKEQNDEEQAPSSKVDEGDKGTAGAGGGLAPGGRRRSSKDLRGIIRRPSRNRTLPRTAAGVHIQLTSADHEEGMDVTDADNESIVRDHGGLAVGESKDKHLRSSLSASPLSVSPSVGSPLLAPPDDGIPSAPPSLNRRIVRTPSVDIKRPIPTSSDAAPPPTSPPQAAPLQKDSPIPAPPRPNWLDRHFPPIHPDSRPFLWWSRFINLLHLYMLIVIPPTFGWTSEMLSPLWVAIQSIVDIFMLVDCWLSSRLAYKNKYGILQTDLKQLRWHYVVETRGWCDVLASLPLDLLVFAVPVTSVPVQFDSTRFIGDTRFYQYKVWAILRFIKLLVRLPYGRVYRVTVPGVPL